MDYLSLLSRGAMADILDGGKPNNPILQILGTKPMTNEQYTTGNNDPKYRLMISDGINSHQYCIVSNQDLVRDIRAGNLEKFTIVKIKVYNIVDAADSSGNVKRILYILNMEIIKPGREVGIKLGNPVARVEGPRAQQQDAPAARNSNPYGADNGNPNNNVGNNNPYANNNMNNNPYNSNNTNSNPYANNNNMNNTSNTYANNTSNPYSNPNNQPTQPQPYNFGNNKDIPKPAPMSNRKENFDMAIIDIGSLTPYVNRWTIKGRVLSKTGIKTWSNAKGEGKLFSFEIADKTGALKVAGFQNECDKFYEYVQRDKVYLLSRAHLKPANKAYTSADYEVTLTAETQLQECTDEREISEMPMQRFNFVSIQSLLNLPVNSNVDLIGVIKKVEPVSTVMSRAKNKELTKRNVIIVDMSRHTISITIWGSSAEEFTGKEDDVFVTKSARVGDYGGRTASAGDYIAINPDIPETRKLKNWYNSRVDENYVNLTNSQDSGSSNDQWKPLIKTIDVESVRDGSTSYSKVKAAVLMIGRNPVYKACPTDGCGKKLVDTVTNEMKCEKCQQTFTHCKYRFKTDVKITDATGQVWVTLWDEKAETLLGYKAEDVQRHMVSDDKELYDKILQAPYFKNYIFVLKSRLDSYNNEEKVRNTVVRLEPLDTVSYGQRLVEEIKAMAA